MRSRVAFSGAACCLSLLAAGVLSVPPAVGAQVNVTRTNWVDHWLTNVIEVRVPVNRFVNHYETNWVEQAVTNHVQVQAINHVHRTITNHVLVNAYVTNYATAYETNWHLLTVTNRLAVERFRTNFVQAYRTNWQMLNLTNFETVLVMKTNWLTQPVTNVVEVEMARATPSAPAARPTTAPHTPTVAPAPALSEPAAVLTDTLTLQAAKTRSVGNLVEVELQVKWRDNPRAPVQVQQWRVEQDGGTFLCFGRGQQFRRALATGKYRVEVRAEREDHSRVLVVRGSLRVNPREASLEQTWMAQR